MGKSCRIILAGKSCGTRRREKCYLRKVVIGGNLACGNRILGSQPIRMQLVKILQGNLAGNYLAGNCCGKILAGKTCGKILWEILQEILVGQGRGKKVYLRKVVIAWKISIWNRVKGSQSIRIQLRKIFWENLVENSCGKFLRDKEEGKNAI